jgi:hypothetical protein
MLQRVPFPIVYPIFETDRGWGRQILDELIIAGEMEESSKKAVLRAVSFFHPSCDDRCASVCHD